LCDLLCHLGTEALGGVETGTDRGPADGQLVQTRPGCLDAVDGVGDLGGVAGPLLAYGQRDGVLQVSAADLDDVPPRLGLGFHGMLKVPHLREQVLVDLPDGGDVHRGGEGVVGGLAHVDVVIGVDGCLGPQCAADQLDRPVADDLVDVHVALRAGPGLPYVQREVVVQRAGDHLVGDAGDQVGFPARQAALAAVDERGGLLDVAVGVVDGLGHAVVADGEVDQGPLRLGAPVPVGGHLDGAHRVRFAAGAGGVDADRDVPHLRWLLSGGVLVPGGHGDASFSDSGP
jgi:hypothetical protein